MASFRLRFNRRDPLRKFGVEFLGGDDGLAVFEAQEFIGVSQVIG
jgi:hypothetical protein